MYIMADKRLDARKIAFTQYGLLSLEQAEEAGWSRKGLRSSWERFLPGVYRAPEVAGSWRQSAMGLCLWGGSGTALSHTAAAALLRLKGFTEGELHVVSTKHSKRLPEWAHVHRLDHVRPGTGRIAGIPVTPPWVTLLDVCFVVTWTEAGRALDDSLLRGLVSLPQMGWALEMFGGPGHPGSARLRALLRERGASGSRYVPPESDLEEYLYKLVATARDLPKPVRQHQMWDGTRWRRFDLAWPEYRLAVEVDGWETHGTREAFQDDRTRDACMGAIGWQTLRFTWHDVVDRPAWVLSTIRATLGQKVQ
jgi:very-short-patch-repair endonuclease